MPYPQVLRIPQCLERLVSAARRAAPRSTVQVELATIRTLVRPDTRSAGDHEQRYGLEDHPGDVRGPAVNSRLNGTAVTNDVVFSMLMNSLPVGG